MFLPAVGFLKGTKKLVISRNHVSSLVFARNKGTLCRYNQCRQIMFLVEFDKSAYFEGRLSNSIDPCLISSVFIPDYFLSVQAGRRVASSANRFL